MTTNFEIEDSIAILFEGRYIDIHNCYDFMEFRYDNLERRLVLTFNKMNGVWVKEEDPKTLIMTHDLVTYLDIKYANEAYQFPDDDKTISGITFFPEDDRVTNDRLVFQEKPNDDDDIIYSFQSEFFIRVGCGKIYLSLNS